jgi:hypothetical protein
MALANMTDEPMIPLQPEDRIYITGGQYRDYKGTIKEIKIHAHVVEEVDGEGIRHIQVEYCDLLVTEAPNSVSSMMFPTANDSDFPQLGDRIYIKGGLFMGKKRTILTVNTSGDYTVHVDAIGKRFIPIQHCKPLQPRRVHGIGRDTTTEVLINLLVQSMLDNDSLSIQEWLQQLQERIDYHTGP